MLKAVYIKLNNEEELKTFEKFKRMTREQYSDITKTTKKLWSDWIKEIENEDAGE